MLKGIMPDEARALLFALPVKTDTETVPLADALGRVLAEELCAEIPIPPFDRSPFDGYAFRGEDTAGATKNNPVRFIITEELPAGIFPKYEVTAGTAAKILTGAPMPRGANATIKYELTEFTDSEVKIPFPVAPNTDVVYAGDDAPRGAALAKTGSVITPPVLGLCASVGRTALKVYKKPRAAVLNTGTELCEPGVPLPPAKIYNSSVFTLTGYLAQFGVDGVNAGVVRDDAAEIAARMDAALKRHDLVITTGGASVGDYDCAVRAAELLGAEILYWKMKLKPGGAIVASVRDGKLILALSGNPGAAVIAMLHVALPYIKKLCGRADCLPEAMDVFLKEPFNKTSQRARILRGRLEIVGGRAFFAEYGEQGGGAISSLTDCDLLGELPAGSPELPAGTMIKAYRV